MSAHTSWLEDETSRGALCVCDVWPGHVWSVMCELNYVKAMMTRLVITSFEASDVLGFQLVISFIHFEMHIQGMCPQHTICFEI